jgi:outer membrane protein assembly factor BamB
VAAILGAAEEDVVLAALLFQVERLVQAQDGIIVPADQLLQARRFLRLLREEAPIGTNDEVQTGSKLAVGSGRTNATIQEGKEQQLMRHERSLLPPDVRARRTHASRLTGLSQAARLLQMTAAALLVGALVAGFLLVFSMRSAPRQAIRTSLPGSPAGIYLSRSDGVYRLNIQTRRVIWHTHVAGQSLFAGDPVILGDTLYIVTDSWVSALNAQTGALRWSHDFQGRVVDPYLDNGLLYFPSLFPLPVALYAVNPANGALTAIYTPLQGQNAWSSPIVVDGILYYLGISALYAVQLPEEKIIWQQPIDSGALIDTFTNIIVQHGVVYVQIDQKKISSNNGLIEAFAAHTGSRLWQSPQFAHGLGQVTVTDKLIYAITLDGELLAFHTHDYALVWRKSLDTYGIRVTSDVLYAVTGSHMHQLTALNAATGNLLWQLQGPRSGLGLDGVQQGVVYAESWSDDGKAGAIYAVDASNGAPIWMLLIGVSSTQWGGIVIA